MRAGPQESIVCVRSHHVPAGASVMQGDGEFKGGSDIPQSVRVFTHNITRRSIAWDPARQRPTQELVHSIHSALHFSLDPCINHPDESPSFCVVPVPARNLSAARGFCLIVPCLKDMAVKPEDVVRNSRGQTTAKLFAGFDGESLNEDDVHDALEALHASTGVNDVHKFVISLEGIKWSGGCYDESQAAGIDIIDHLKDPWQVIVAVAISYAPLLLSFRTPTVSFFAT